MWQNYVTEIVSKDVHKILFVLISKNVSSISVWRWEVTKTLKNIPNKFFAHFCYNFWRGGGFKPGIYPFPGYSLAYIRLEFLLLRLQEV